MTGDSIETPAPDPVKKPRKPRASEPAPEEAKAETADEETLPVADVDQPQADEDGGTDETDAVTTEVEQPKVEEHETQPQAAAEPPKQSGVVSDKVTEGKSMSQLMRFRMRTRKRRR